MASSTFDVVRTQSSSTFDVVRTQSSATTQVGKTQSRAIKLNDVVKTVVKTLAKSETPFFLPNVGKGLSVY